jgi:PIN like domain
MIRELVDALQQRGRVVHMHRQVFPDGTPDRVWIPDVAERGWIIVTRDRRLQNRHIEWMAFLRARARVLWFKGDRASGTDITEAFLSALPAVDEITARLAPPYILKIALSGGVEQIYPDVQI